MSPGGAKCVVGNCAMPCDVYISLLTEICLITAERYRHAAPTELDPRRLNETQISYFVLVRHLWCRVA
jgi:hypothetical protein